MDTSIPMNAHETNHVHTHKHHHKHKEKDMLGSVGGTPVITGGDGSGMGLGAGLGGGLLGGILGGALLGNRNGLFGNNGNVEGVVTPSMLTSGLADVTETLQNTTMLQSMGDIKASVPYAESQVQLALAGAQSDITQQNQAQTLALTQQGFQAQLATTAGFANTKDAVDSLSTQVAVGQGVTNTNIERLGWQLSTQINSDGEKTRALISANETARLNQQLITAQNEIIELRNEGRRREDRHGIEITMTNNQNQNNLQFQQQQQQFATVGNLLNGLAQSIHATNQAINIGGTQLASPTNTNTNVRA